MGLSVVSETTELPFEEFLPREPALKRQVTPGDMLKVMNQVAAVLTIRALLAVAIVGGIVLTAYTVAHVDTPKLIALGLYNAMIVWPLAALARRP